MKKQVTAALQMFLIAGLLGACTGMPAQDPSKARRMAESNVELGIAYMRQGELETALMKLNRALEQDPKLPSAHHSIAILYDRLGNAALSEEHYQTTLRLNPNESKAHNNYGRFLCSKGRYPEAEEHFIKAASNPLYTDIPGALTNAGICANRISDWNKAEHFFRQALEHDPEYARALLQMVGVTYNTGNYLSARAYLERFKGAASHDAESLWLGVRIEDALGDNNASSSYALLLKNKFPDTRQAKALKEWENERRSR
ncbi:MAG: type IV pilus biogenesis/stability protein PilW [Gammaproteobacteria bacterium]|nr:type IV pilus biogenesis/stability protein PilW [Gammaproteobacteria bacterium]